MERDYQLQTFELERGHWWYRARQRVIIDVFQRTLTHRRGLRILEVGCGGGTLLKSLATFGESMGLDSCAEAVEHARRLAGCPVHLGAIPSAVPSGLPKFDVVCLFDVLEHIEDDVDALRSVGTMLSGGGHVFLTVPAMPWLFGIHDEINGHHRRYTASRLRSRLALAGFVDARCYYFNALLSPVLVPAIVWRNVVRKGHHFEVQSRWGRWLEVIFAMERHAIGRIPFPIGLSLMAVARVP